MRMIPIPLTDGRGGRLVRAGFPPTKIFHVFYQIDLKPQESIDIAEILPQIKFQVRNTFLRYIFGPLKMTTK